MTSNTFFDICIQMNINVGCDILEWVTILRSEILPNFFISESCFFETCYNISLEQNRRWDTKTRRFDPESGHCDQGMVGWCEITITHKLNAGELSAALLLRVLI